MSTRLRVGDMVVVISGGEAVRGKQGRITRLINDEDRVVIEGVNVVTRHQRPTPRNQKGGKITKEAPIHVSRVMPIDPKTGKPTRVRHKVVDDGDKKKKVRIAKSGAEITSG